MSKKIWIAIVILLICVCGIGGYFLFENYIKASGIKKQVITLENYEDISNKVREELKDTDDMYYFSYACMYYIMKDGFTEEYMTTQDNSLLYKNIQNKTVQSLINEGKKLMKDNEMTVEKWKEQIEELDNNINN